MTNGVLNADGVAYKALVVMQDELPLAAAEKLLAFAKEGLPILFVDNVTEDVNNEHVMKVNSKAGSTTGSNDGKDAELAEVVQQIKALSANVKTVNSPADAYEALQALNVTPRVAYGKPNAKLLTNMRKDTDATYLYVYNYMYEDTENYKGEISVEGAYQPYLLNTWNGEVTKVTDAYSANVSGAKTTLNIDLAPGDVAVYILDPSNVAVKEEDNSKSYEISLSKWKLSVDSYTPGKKVERKETNPATNVSTTEVTYETNHATIDAGTLDKLVPWKDIKTVGETVSGVGTYTNTFTLPENWNTASDTLVFKAGRFSLVMHSRAHHQKQGRFNLLSLVLPGQIPADPRSGNSVRCTAGPEQRYPAG